MEIKNAANPNIIRIVGRFDYNLHFTFVKDPVDLGKNFLSIIDAQNSSYILA